jgi:peptidoglycan hydrolase CwlO-like protein
VREIVRIKEMIEAQTIPREEIKAIERNRERMEGKVEEVRREYKRVKAENRKLRVKIEVIEEQLREANLNKY